MAELGTIVQTTMNNAPSVIWILIAIIVGITLLLIFGGGFFYYWYNHRRFNLTIEIKKPRNDGRIVVSDIGKGIYDAGKGVIHIQTPQSKKTIPMKIFDTKKYLQGKNIISVIQIGPSDFRPYLNDSCVIKKDSSGIESAEIDIEVDIENNKAWMVEYERAVKNAFSLKNFLKNNQSIVAICVVIICSFMGFVALYAKISGGQV